MRNPSGLKKTVLWCSVGVCIGSLALAVYLAGFHHSTVPLWDKTLMAYGVIFCVFVFFDKIGRESAAWRRERNASSPRPRPQVASRSAQRVAASTSPLFTVGQIHLERVRPAQEYAFRQMVQACFEEVWALDDQKPVYTDDGKMVGVPVDNWLQEDLYHPFFIMYHDRMIGSVVVKTVYPSCEIVLFYIESAMRRRAGGSVSIKKLVDFIRLLGVYHAMTAEVSTANMRGQYFLKSCGFQKSEHVSGFGTVVFSLKLDEVES